MLTHFYCLEKWKRYTSPMYPMANELTCLDFSYFRLYVTFPQSQQELISNTPAVQFRYLADFLLQCIQINPAAKQLFWLQNVIDQTIYD